MNVTYYTPTWGGGSGCIDEYIKKDTSAEEFEELWRNECPELKLDVEISGLGNTLLHIVAGHGNLPLMHYILGKADGEDKASFLKDQTKKLCFIRERSEKCSIGRVPLHCTPKAKGDAGYLAAKLLIERGVPIDVEFSYGSKRSYFDIVNSVKDTDDLCKPYPLKEKNNLLTESLWYDAKMITMLCLRKGMTCPEWFIDDCVKNRGIDIKPHIENMSRMITNVATFIFAMAKSEEIPQDLFKKILYVSAEVFMHMPSPVIEAKTNWANLQEQKEKQAKEKFEILLAGMEAEDPALRRWRLMFATGQS